MNRNFSYLSAIQKIVPSFLLVFFSIQFSKAGEPQQATAINELIQFCGLPPQPLESYISSEVLCRKTESGNVELEKRVLRFIKNGNVSREYFYAKNKVSRVHIYNFDGVKTGNISVTFVSVDEWFLDSFDVKTNRWERRGKYKGSAEYDEKPLHLEEWLIDNDTPKEINSIDSETGLVTRRQMLDEKGLPLETFEFVRAGGKKSKFLDPYLLGIKIFGRDLNLVGSYLRGQEIDPLRILRSEQEKSHYNSAKSPVLFIDSGFDIHHPLLTRSLWKNPFEILDGIDNDKNGWIDDINGWNILSKSNDISDMILTPTKGEPISHGTHVASIGMRNITQFCFLGFAGNMASPILLEKTIFEIKRKKIRFVNMSFGWDSEDNSQGGSPFSPGSDSTNALERLISSSPDTLFVVAAGNDGKLLSLSGFCSYPPCFKYPNMIKVGSVNLSDFNENPHSAPEVSDFSNYSEELVDVFAPGEYVLAAGIGNRMIKLSGTSMATPMVFNVLLKMAEANPTLSIYELKEILMTTVTKYKLKGSNHFLPCKSGGMVNPSLAVKKAREFRSPK